MPRCGLAARWRLGAPAQLTGSGLPLLPPALAEAPSEPTSIETNIPRSHEEIDQLQKEGLISLDSREWGSMC